MATKQHWFADRGMLCTAKTLYFIYLYKPQNTTVFPLTLGGPCVHDIFFSKDLCKVYKQLVSIDMSYNSWFCNWQSQFFSIIVWAIICQLSKRLINPLIVFLCIYKSLWISFLCFKVSVIIPNPLKNIFLQLLPYLLKGAKNFVVV